MKKVLSLALCCIMLFAFAGCAKDKAKAGSKVSEALSASAGDTVEIPVYLTNNPGMAAAYLKITYDSNVFEFVGKKDGNVFANHQVSPVDTNAVSLVTTVSDEEFKNGKDNKNTGTIVTLRFKVKDNVKKGNYNLTVSEYQFINMNEQEVKATVKLPKIKIK